MWPTTAGNSPWWLHRQGFLAPGTDITPIVPALEKIWAEALGQSMAAFNFRTVTSKFNELVYQYPIRIPERYSLVIRRGPRLSVLYTPFVKRCLPEFLL